MFCFSRIICIPRNFEGPSRSVRVYLCNIYFKCKTHAFFTETTRCYGAYIILYIYICMCRIEAPVINFVPNIVFHLVTLLIVPEINNLTICRDFATQQWWHLRELNLYTRLKRVWNRGMCFGFERLPAIN